MNAIPRQYIAPHMVCALAVDAIEFALDEYNIPRSADHPVPDGLTPAQRVDVTFLHQLQYALSPKYYATPEIGSMEEILCDDPNTSYQVYALLGTMFQQRKIEKQVAESYANALTHALNLARNHAKIMCPDLHEEMYAW